MFLSENVFCHFLAVHTVKGKFVYYFGVKGGRDQIFLRHSEEEKLRLVKI
jgi:hypothetical protein